MQLLDTALLAHKGNVDFLGETVSKRIHASSGIAKL